MKRREKKERQVFWFSLGMSLFVLLTAVGVVAVDSRSRRLSFGDETPAFRAVSLPGERTALEVRLFGRETAVEITQLDKLWKIFLDFTCIPHN